MKTRRGRPQDPIRMAAKAKAIFNFCTRTYREIRGGSLISATDYSDAMNSGASDYSAGRPNRSDFCVDLELASRHVVKHFNVPWEKFEIAYLAPWDLDDRHEAYVEHIFGTHHRVLDDDANWKTLHQWYGADAARILKDRNRRAKLENACGLEYEKRGLLPTTYFHFERRGIDGWKNSASTNVRHEKLSRVNAGGDSPSQSEIELLLDTAFAYQEAQGGAPVDEPIPQEIA